MRIGKHGLNPGIPNCYYCNKPKNEIILTSRAESPHNKVVDKIPCDECAGWMEKGVICISVKSDETDMENPYRTGGWAVVTPEAIMRMVTPTELAINICKRRVAFVPDDAWDILGLPRNETK